MVDMSKDLSQSAFLTLEPTYWRYASPPDEPTGFRITRVTQKRPTNLSNGAVAVEVTVQVPVAAFMPLKPSALIIVPEELVQHEVVAEVTT